MSDFCQFVRMVKRELRMTRSDRSELLQRAAAAMPAEARAVTNEAGALRLLPEEGRAICSAFFEGLGKSMLPDQLSLCDRCLEEALPVLSHCGDEASRRQRFILSLSTLAGLFVAILLY